MRRMLWACAMVLAIGCGTNPTGNPLPDAGGSTPDAGGNAPDAGSPAIASILVQVDPDLICTDLCSIFAAGVTRRFVAIAFDANHQEIPDISFTWSVADETVASVDEQGNVTGQKEGETEVIAKAGGLEGRAVVTIQVKRVWSIVLTPDHAEVADGATATFTAEAQDELGLTILDAQFLWSVGDTSVATVENGIVTGVGPGTTIVQVATDRGGSAWARVTVTSTDPAPHGHVFQQIATGDAHACGLEADGTASCWGWNYYGQLGDNHRGSDQERFPTPAPVVTDVKFKSLALAGHHSCGIALDDKTWCWGSNDSGALGVDDVPRHTGGTTVPYAVLVPEGTTFRELAGGLAHTCAIDTAGVLWCWGAGFAGQNGSTTPEVWVPEPIASATTFAHITGGLSHTCALDVNGAAYCWGANSDGQLGSGTLGDAGNTHVPTAVQGGHVFTQLVTRSNHTCALEADGKAFCWGRNEYGQLGDGTAESRVEPAAVATSERFAQLVTGAHHTCGRKASGEVLCWGNNTNAQLGNGGLDASTTPVPVLGTQRFAKLDAGPDFTCGVTFEGEGWCWGTGYFGSLGNGQGGETTIAVAPVPVLAPAVRP